LTRSVSYDASNGKKLMAKVRLHQIARRFSDVAAVENISFEVPDGEFWVLVGPSGCGKSTILRMVAGLDFPTSGEIYIADQNVNNRPARDRDVAMVFQNYALYPHMTVAENLAFGLKMRHVEPAKIQQRLATVAEALELSHLLKRKPKQLSGGQQQRVALGRAIARQPQVFLLDEPLSNLDAQLRDDTRVELKRLHQQVGITTLYVTHDQVEAMTLADQIVVLSQGRIQQIGTPQQIYQTPANRMVATFLGNPAMNLLHSTYQNGVFHLKDQSIPCPPHLQAVLNDLQSQTVDIGIRPEFIQVEPELTEGNLTVTVGVVEPLGRETLIRAFLTPEPRQTLNLVTQGGLSPARGDRLAIRPNLNQLMVFDTQTGDRLA
jgi:multiple sugar transport system ATP-binding protein